MHCFIQFVLGTSLLLYSTLYSLAESEDCMNVGYFATRLTIDSRRTWYKSWMSEVELVHKDGNKQGGAWTSNIHQRTSKCENNDSNNSANDSNGFVSVDVTLIGPPQDAEAPPRLLFEERWLWLGVGGGAVATLVSVSRAPLGWEEARRACQERGGDLLADVVGAARAAPHLLWRASAQRAFVGWRRSPDPRHQFLTVAEVPVETDKWVHWAPGHPTSEVPLAQDACGALGIERLLYDVSCDEPLPFFCQRAL